MQGHRITMLGTACRPSKGPCPSMVDMSPSPTGKRRSRLLANATTSGLFSGGSSTTFPLSPDEWFNTRITKLRFPTYVVTEALFRPRIVAF